MYLSAYLQRSLTVTINKTTKYFTQGTAIKVDPATHQAYIGEYQITLKRRDYAIIH